jgi:glycosyltransferase involved in cell wall biosynthesis
MAGNKTKIYYQDSGYPVERNLVNLPFNSVEITKKIGLSKVISHVHYKLRGKSQLLGNSHWELTKKKRAVWHFFNTISFGKTPWVVTYETSLPRWETNNKKLLSYGVRTLADDTCKKLIALSECAQSIQQQFLVKQFPDFMEQIASKITVIHPPQKLLITDYAAKKLPENKLVFTLIGADFFRKGGREVLRVFDHLLQQNHALKLNIISTLQYDDYASQATEDDLKEAKRIIRKYPDAIQHYERLPNPKVLELLKESHVGLLPTYGDTYGYSVLEAQACGCPVISTDLRALPEINNDQCGWVINVPKNDWGNGVLGSAKERDRFSKIVTDALLEIMNDLISDPGQISIKGKASMNRILAAHNPEDTALKLMQIYADIIPNE